MERKKIHSELVLAVIRHRVSYRGAPAMFDVLNDNKDMLCRVLQSSKGLTSYGWAREQLGQHTPPVWIDILLERKSSKERETNKERVMLIGKRSFPRTQFPREKWNVIYEISYCKASPFLSSQLSGSIFC